MRKPDRVFLPLTKQNFEDFRRGKKWELRRAERGFAPKHIRTGRHVTISCGYSGERIEGTIGQVHVGTLEEILARVSFLEIEPRAANNAAAIEMNVATLGRVSRYVAFETILEKKPWRYAKAF